MGLFAIMFGLETDVDPEMVARLSDPGSWEATDRRRDYAMAGSSQPAHRPAQGYPPVQYASQQYQPAQYGQLNDMQRCGPPAIVRAPIRDKRCFANAVVCNASGELIVFTALLDTGANFSYMTHATAQRIGISLRNLDYSGTTRTQTGHDRSTNFIVPDIHIVEDPNMRQGGRVGADDIEMSILQRDTLRYDILGMNFLEKLNVSIAGGVMVLSE
jgi:clan AA aspartic protease (TIGR02281 family)